MMNLNGEIIFRGGGSLIFRVKPVIYQFGWNHTIRRPVEFRKESRCKKHCPNLGNGEKNKDKQDDQQRYDHPHGNRERFEMDQR